MEKVTFEPNLPVCVRLKYPVGKIVSGVYGEQIFYSTQDGKAMYLDMHVGQMVNELNPKVGEPILLMKKWSGKKTERPEWHVWREDGSDPNLVAKLAQSHGMTRASQLGEQPDGTFRVPAAAPKSEGNSRQFPSASAAIAPSNGANALAPRKQPETAATPQAWTDRLLAETNALVDVYAAAWDYAKRYQGAIKPEEVRAFVTTAYINSRNRVAQ